MAERPVTEAGMLEALRARYSEERGNGEGWAFIPKTRDAASWDGRRTIDAVAMALWKSKHFLLHAFEVKVSRSDWLREMRDPAKSEGWLDVVDRFWLAVNDPAIVKEGELPEAWGLLAFKRGRLECVVQAPALRDRLRASPADEPLPAGFDRSFLAALLKSATRVSGVPKEAIEAAREEATETAKRVQQSRVDGLAHELERYKAREKAFADVLGLGVYRLHEEATLRAVAGEVKLALEGRSSAEEHERRLRAVAASAKRVAVDVERELESIGLLGGGI